MLPLFNSLPYNSNQIQTDGANGSAAQQVMPSNHCQGNPSTLLPNSMQIQSQMGIINPQMVVPFNNSSTHLSNGTIAMPNRPVLTPSPCFMNATNHFLPLQNGVSLLGQCHGGFGHHNLNSFATFPAQSMNGMNPSQPPSQLFAHNSMNLPQYFNQNAGFPNGQFCLQSPMQNMNQFVQMPMSNYAQAVPCNLPPCLNQVSQAMGRQNPTFFANPQFGLVHSNGAMQPGNQDQHKFILPTVDVNASKQTPNTTRQLQGNSSLPLAFGSVQPQQTQKNFRPPFLMKSQGNPGKDIGIDNLNTNGNNSQNRNFTRNPKRDALRRGFPKSQFHHMQNTNRKFGFHNEHGGKGYNNDGTRKSGVANSSNQTRVEQKRTLCLNYTEQEIQQWREERKKNYPSKANMEKKLIEPEFIDKDAKLRCQQLKEILAKQAELGCEVAEIPSYYLSDSEKQVNGREENKRALTKKERFQNKFNKRGRFCQNDRFSKKQRLADHDSCNMHDQNDRFSKNQRLADNDSSTRPTLNKREPTLLQRLLSADIRRDKSRLLQVFRFMVMNSFFKNWPEKSLHFPLVIVKETGCEGEVVGEISSSMGKGASEGSHKTMIKESEDVDDDDDNGNHEHDAQVKEVAKLEGSIGGETEEPEEEEGEIID